MKTEPKKYYYNSTEVCRNCNGTGQTHERNHIGHSRYETESSTCNVCDGEGMVKINKEISVTITPFRREKQLNN